MRRTIAAHLWNLVSPYGLVFLIGLLGVGYSAAARDSSTPATSSSTEKAEYEVPDLMTLPEAINRAGIIAVATIKQREKEEYFLIQLGPILKGQWTGRPETKLYAVEWGFGQGGLDHLPDLKVGEAYLLLLQQSGDKIELVRAGRLAFHLLREGASDPKVGRVRQMLEIQKRVSGAERFKSLLAQLSSPDPDIRCAVIFEFGFYNGQELIAQPLAERLRGDTDPDVRLAATKAGVMHCLPTFVPALVSSLDDKDERVVRAALKVSAVQQVGDALPKILQKLDIGGDLMEELIRALGYFPSQAASDKVRALIPGRACPPEAWEAALHAAVEFKDPAAVGPILERLKEDFSIYDGGEKQEKQLEGLTAMVNALAELPAQAGEKEILLAIVTDQRRKGDDFERLRTRAGVALARLSDPETVAPLLTLISSRKEESHADEIVENLGGFQDPRITALLTKALEKGSESESRALAAVEALYRQATSGDARREEVKRQFQAAWKKEEKRGKKTDTVDLRLALAGRLAQLGDDSKEGFVRSELQFPSGGLGFTISVDSKGGDSGKGELMADQLRQMLGGIMQTSRRDKAIESLALFRDPQAVSAVERILNETKDEVDGVELTRTLELAEKVASLDRDRIAKAVLSLLGRSTIDLDNKLSLRRTLNRIQAAATTEPQKAAGKP